MYCSQDVSRRAKHYIFGAGVAYETVEIGVANAPGYKLGVEVLDGYFDIGAKGIQVHYRPISCRGRCIFGGRGEVDESVNVIGESAWLGI